MNSKFVRYTVEKYYIVKNKNRPVHQFLSQLFNFLTTVVPIFRILVEHGYQTFLSRIDMKRKERRNRSCKKVYCIGLYISYGDVCDVWKTEGKNRRKSRYGIL